MNTLITICARGGSKGLPNKHLLNFNGKPLILWTVKQAVDWGKGDIVLSSDSSDIISLFLTHFFNHNIINRPNDLSGDDVPKLDVIRHALIDTEERLAKHYDVIVDLDATNPLRTLDDITGCWSKVAKLDYSVAFSVVRTRRNPYFNMVERGIGRWQLCKNVDYVTSRQEAPVVYELNSSIYAYKRDWLLNTKHKSPLDSEPGIWRMSDCSFCDIDSEIDFKVAEFLMREYLKP